MTEITRTDRHTDHEHDTLPPTDPYAAAGWLIARNPWLQQLAERVVGPITASHDWLDELAEAVRDTGAHAEAMRIYEARHLPPDDDLAYERWLAAGPKISPNGHAFAVMSSGEKRVVRLLATLSDTRLGWSVHDVTGLGDRGARILADWLQIVRAQLPDWLYRGDSPFRPMSR